MIYDDLVEMAARAEYEAYGDWGPPWPDLMEANKVKWRTPARAALSAIAPRLRAEGMREAVAHMGVCLSQDPIFDDVKRWRADILARAAELESTKE